MKKTLIAILTLLLTATLFIFVPNATAQVVSIPDVNLAAAIRDASGLPVGAPITTSTMLKLRELNASDLGITDLTGLAYATNLTDLYLSSTEVSDVAPLENLTQLTVLDLDDTAVSDVAPLATLTRLEALYLDNIAVSDVGPLANLTQLTELYLSHTAVSDVAPLANLTRLTGLYLSSTEVSDVGPLANLTQLTELDIGNTAVSDVAPLATLTRLEALYLDDTAVSDVGPLEKLTRLTDLHLSHTAVSDVAPLANLTLLGGLWLTDCPLSYASIHTHIPALQAQGIAVAFDNVAHTALLKTSGDRQEGTGGTALPNPFVVTATDKLGKPIVGKPVLFEILEGGGTLSAQIAKTDALGKAQITLTLGRAAGVNKVKATAGGILSWVLFTAVATEAAPQLAADVNGDGVVDIADLIIVAIAIVKPVQNPRVDVNGDGVVDGEDVERVAAALGEGAAAAPSQAALPAGLTLEKVTRALDVLYAENTGSPAFQRAIAKLEGFLASLIPEETALLANYPNPFNPETWIPYHLATPAEVTVTIYAANGMVVRTLALGHQRAGDYASRPRAAYWDGMNALGERVASGVYFYTLQAGDFAATRKMLILK